MIVQGLPHPNNITREISDIIVQASLPALIENPNTIVQVSVCPLNGPAFYFRR